MTLYNARPTSKTLGRRCVNVRQMGCVCWAGGLSLKHSTFVQCWFNVGPASQTLPCTVGYCMPTAMNSIYATVGPRVTVPRMTVLQLYESSRVFKVEASKRVLGARPL